MSPAETLALPENDLQSILAALTQEIRTAGESKRNLSLEIDAVEHVQNSGGRFHNRLALSRPISVPVDESLTFRERNSKEQIPAVVLKNDDEGPLVETQQPLPTTSTAGHRVCANH